MEQNDICIKDFKTLIVWQKARELAQDIYLITANFPQFETYATKSQIIRAVTSIGSNIAEGNGQLYKKKQINFLNNALASASETRHWLITALDNKYISQEDYNKLEQKTIEIIRMLIGYIRKLQERADEKEIV
ncbi:four helix bundle protein [Caldicellulosiruptor sp. DIB 104C]|uniref:four helix bundle protein n=1 Tax=Caldicellulosiruptor sp. DIB 104C TaxID=3019889 RepID=UPI0023051C26|nr:four helix bundle protein [Caldicellulosiruptor sp. DIB 104C]